MLPPAIRPARSFIARSEPCTMGKILLAVRYIQHHIQLVVWRFFPMSSEDYA